jgi:hypothetical protein
MQVLNHRGEVIRWAGAVHAYPVLRGEQPDLSRAGEDETGARRVGWRQFFTALREKKLLVVVEAPDGFDHKLIEGHKAHTELPAAAFGPPLWKRVLHEITLE